MTRRSSFAALVAVAALAVAGCANNDAKRSDIENAMKDAGLDDEQAACIADGVDGEFGDNQDLMNDIGSADDPSEFPRDTEPVIDGIVEDCLATPAGGGAAGDDAETSDTTSPDEPDADASADDGSDTTGS